MSAHRILGDLFRAPYLMLDPGDAGTITVDRQLAQVPLALAAAETRTLAQPTKAGLVCTVAVDSDSAGSCTLTVTGGYNADSDTTISLADAADFVTFISIKVGTSYYWRIVVQEGTSASMEDLSIDKLTIGGTEVTATAAELNQIDGAILADMTPGTGISAVATAICEHSVVKVGGLFKTTILIDLTGLNSGDADHDIIGKADTANCHIGQITAAVNGTIFAGKVTCLEAPTGGEPDIDLYSATVATGTEEALVTDLTETALLDAGADWTAGATKVLSAYPAANGYLYLAASGGVTNDTYTAGILLIELWGKA
jgi:hypothetical protein